jgi:hypothetical protein
MAAGAIDSCAGDGTGAKNEFVIWREGIDPRRIFLREEMSPESLSA